MRRPVVGLLSLAFIAGCGSSHSSGASSDDTSTSPTPPASPTATPFQTAGVWQVAGSDARGAYHGEAEVVADGAGGWRVTRVVKYDTAMVENGRELWWVWEGTATGDAANGLAITVPLTIADFIVSRGSLARTAGATEQVTGNAYRSGDGMAAAFHAVDVDASESWSGWAPSGGAPIFSTSRTVVAAHDPPDPTLKATMFATFASYQSLPNVAPYANDADFQAAIHGYVVDKTDFDFYRAHPEAIRVVDKVIDDISTEETLARAQAFGRTLDDKAKYFDTDTPANFVDSTGSVQEQRVNGVMQPTGDDALWTATWIASQAYRWQVTQEPAALANVERGVGAIDLIAEIPQDPTVFARAVKPHDPAVAAPWTAGSGAFAAYDWLPNGNNDMYKGLLYGWLSAYDTLCVGAQASSHGPDCDRIRTDAASVADHVTLVTANANLNQLTALWLAAYVTGDPSYLLRAAPVYLLQQTILQNGNALIYSNGIADWSGTHLAFVEYVAMFRLEKDLDLGALTGADVNADLRAGIAFIDGMLGRQHLALWDLAFAALETAPHASRLDDATQRLREFPCPKMEFAVDHTISPDFVMSPYPSDPWKFDWTTNDRSQSLRSYPLFEEYSGVYLWKDNPLDYRTNTSAGIDHSGVDFLHAYWFGRAFGVLPAGE